MPAKTAKKTNQPVTAPAAKPEIDREKLREAAELIRDAADELLFSDFRDKVTKAVKLLEPFKFDFATQKTWYYAKQHVELAVDDHIELEECLSRCARDLALPAKDEA